MDVVNQTGFDPVDAGSLDESWRQEPGTPAYCCDYEAEMTRKGLSMYLAKHVRLSARNFTASIAK